MRELKKEIQEKLKLIEKMIENNYNEKEIKKEIKILNKMLEKYTNQL